MKLEQGDIVFLSGIDPEMTEKAFEALLIGKSQNTTVPTMRKAKALIMRDLLTRGTERKGINDDMEIIAGTYRQQDDRVICRVFTAEKNDRTTLVWQGDSNQFRSNYMRIRDDLAGTVPYRLHGKAAAKVGENQAAYSGPSHDVFKKIANEAAVQREMPAISGNSRDSSNSIPDKSASISGGMPSWLQEVRRCSKCFKSENPCVFIGQEGHARPLFYEGGNWESDILFVMEAPNYGDTFNPAKGRMTFGEESDPTGRFFEECLRTEVGMEPEQIMVVNSVFCLPACKDGRYPVSSKQKRYCSTNLKSVIESIDPRIVVTLGGAALDALKLIEKHDLTLRNQVAEPTAWFGRILFPLYHPSNLGRVSRSTAKQRTDYRALRVLMDNFR